MAGVSERIQIIVSQTGAVTVKKDIESIGSASEKASRGVDMLKGILATVISAATINQLIKFADVGTSLTNSLKNVGFAGEALADTQEKLYGIAMKNGQSVEGLTAVFSRLTTVQKQLGTDSEGVMTATDNIAWAMARASGNTQSQAGALFQLQQMLGGNVVQMQEYNSLIDGAYPILQAVAKGNDQFKGSVAALTAAVKAGGYPVKQFFAEFQLGSARMRAEAAPMQQTIGQALTNIETAFIRATQQISNGTGVFSALAGAINFVAFNLNTFLLALTPVAAALAILAVKTIGGMVIGAFGALITAIGSAGLMLVQFAGYVAGLAVSAIASLATGLLAATRAMIGLTVAMVTNPFVLLGVVVTGIVAGFAAWAIGMDGITAGFDILYAKASAALNWIANKLAMLGIISQGTLEIILNADDPYAKIMGAFQTGAADAGNVIKEAHKTGGTYTHNPVVNAHKEGGNEAGKSIKEAHKSGAQELKLTYAEAVNMANGVYRTFTGEIIKSGKTMADSVKKGATDGGKAAGDAVKKAGDHGATVMKKAVSEGGAQAGKSMENSIKVGGVEFGQEVYNAVANASDRVGRTIAAYMDAEITKLRAETEKLRAEASAIRTGKGVNGSSGSNSSDRAAREQTLLKSYAFGDKTAQSHYDALASIDLDFTNRLNDAVARGDQKAIDKIIANSNVRASDGFVYQPVYAGGAGSFSESSYRAGRYGNDTPDRNYGEILTNANARKAEQSAPTSTADAMGYANQPPVQIVNRMDPTTQLEVLDTSEGHRVIMNVIKRRRQDIRAVLGTP